ncbi:hypothetical protein J6590_030414 [Homalodisca vitripennis]|nr:hypothetical protein J6590_030414 [Homalodisca vitripennis]
MRKPDAKARMTWQKERETDSRGKGVIAAARRSEGNIRRCGADDQLGYVALPW